MKKSVKNKKKSSQSGIISVVLLILIVIIAIIVVWNIILPMIYKSKEGSDISQISTNIQIASAKLYVTGGADIIVKRVSGAGNITAFKFIFYDKKGNSNTVKRENLVLGESETKTYRFDASELNFNNGDIAQVSVVPMLGSNLGIESKETAELINKDLAGNRILDAPPNLVAWWRLDGDYTDSVGNNHGSCTSCPTPVADNKGNPGMALRFDHSKFNYISVDSPAINSIGSPGSEYTLTAWAYNFNDIHMTSILEKWATFPSQYPFTMRDSACVIFRDAPWEYDDVGYGTTGELPTKWTFVTCVFNSNVTTYINGDKEVTIINNLHDNDNRNQVPLFMGTRNLTSLDSAFNGYLDNIMIYDRALNSGEINALYNNFKS